MELGRDSDTGGQVVVISVRTRKLEHMFSILNTIWFINNSTWWLIHFCRLSMLWS